MIGREPEGYKTLKGVPDSWLRRAVRETEAACVRSSQRGDRWHERTGEKVLRILVAELSRRHQESEEAA